MLLLDVTQLVVSYGKGKIKGAKLMAGEKNYQETLGKLGTQPELSEDLFNHMQKFVRHLFGQACVDINTARCNLFRLGKHSDELLPPTKDFLRKHVMRANYQTACWRRSLEQLMDLPNSVSYGWKTEDGSLAIGWCDLPPAPDTILKNYSMRMQNWRMWLSYR